MLTPLLEPQSRLRDNPLKFQVLCPQNGTAALKGLHEDGVKMVSYEMRFEGFSLRLVIPCRVHFAYALLLLIADTRCCCIYLQCYLYIQGSLQTTEKQAFSFGLIACPRRVGTNTYLCGGWCGLWCSSTGSIENQSEKYMCHRYISAAEWGVCICDKWYSYVLLYLLVWWLIRYGLWVRI